MTSMIKTNVFFDFTDFLGGLYNPVKIKGPPHNDDLLYVGQNILAHNTAGWSGGNLATVGYATVLVEQMSLLHGIAMHLDGGGGYLGFGAHVKTTNTVVKGNKANRRGGGLALDSSVGLSDVNVNKQAVLMLAHTTIMENVAEKDGGGEAYGGGVALTGASELCDTTNLQHKGCPSPLLGETSTTSKTSKIQYNGAVKGAGVYVTQANDDTTVLSNLWIDTNCATNDEGMLQQLLDGDGEAACTAMPINADENKGQGGGMYCNGGTCALQASLLTKNRAEKRGGGVVVAVRGVLQLSASSITTNIATYGGGIATDDFYGPCEISDSGFNSQLDSNTAVECGGNIEIQGSLQPVYVKGYGKDAASCMSANLKGMIIR